MPSKVIQDYEEIGAKKRADRDSNLIKEWLIPESKLPKSKDVLKFPEESGYLSEKEIEVTTSSAPKIVNYIAEHKWTSYEVTSAFCHRSQIAQQLCNCLSEIFYKEALSRARELDTYYEQTGKLKGPLHGLPISLKDNINVKNHASTIGMVDFCFNPKGGMKQNSAIAAMLLDMGAVFYCKTNVPVAMMMPETTNHVYGTTTNPCNRLLSPGGSSGGAACQAALRGSCIEIGSDIGGSIRIPSSFTNIYGLRPTYGRYPTYGTRSGLPGLESVHSVNGPLCASLESLEFYMKTLANGDPSQYDPGVAYRPWQQIVLPSVCSFAVLMDDGHIKPTPPITRGLKMVTEALIKHGHKILDWNPAEHDKLQQLISDFFVADGGKHVLKVTEATGEPLYPYMSNYGTSSEISAGKLWDLQSKRSAVCKAFLDRWMSTAKTTGTGHPIDAIIAPVTPMAGSPLDKFGDYVGYTSVFNALDYSVGIIPVSRANKRLDPVDKSFKPRNASEKFIWDNYDPEETEGGSIGVQIACRRGEEEKVVALMKMISGYLGK